MWYRFLRDSFWGQIAYHLSRKRIFRHPEELPDYIIPDKYAKEEIKCTKISYDDENTPSYPKDKTSDSNSFNTLDNSDDVLVSWEGEDDPENPYNWPLLQKIIFIGEIVLLTVAVYMASAVYTPGIEDVMAKFRIGRVVATLPLTLYVIGYGVGPMIFSPMSENPALGRTSIYLVTLFLFFILQIPTALVNNIAGFCILRFISGLFASPALATGGASIGDIISLPYMPVIMANWGIAAWNGVALGPMFGSIIIVKRDWRWTFWFIAMVSGSAFVILGLFLPESYGKTILYRKAKRLRKLTGNNKIVSKGEIESRHFSLTELAIDTLWRPMEISLTEPVVLLINLYISLVYSIAYLWFEAFPIVFLQTKKFTLVTMGISYLSISIGTAIGAVIYISIIYLKFTKVVKRSKEVTPEVFIPVCIIGAILMPVGLFIFAWTSSPDLHWIGPLIGSGIFAIGAFIVFQTLLNYLGASFYRYIASVFAGNALFRSVMAGCFPLFGTPLYNNLGSEKFPVGWGSSVLGFISSAMVLIPVLFYLNGPKLRARSKYAGSENE